MADRPMSRSDRRLPPHLGAPARRIDLRLAAFHEAPVTLERYGDGWCQAVSATNCRLPRGWDDERRTR